MNWPILEMDQNLRKGLRCIDEAASSGANIVCLPELFHSGYDLNILKNRLSEASADVPGPVTDELGKKASQHKIYVIAGLIERGEIPGTVYVSAVLIAPNGELQGRYRKVHLSDAYLEYHFRPGQDFPVFETSYGKIGMIICYDADFPESSRILAVKGAELIFCPSAWAKPLEFEYDIVHRANALANQLYMVTVNHVGTEGEYEYFGKSIFIDPRGRIIADASNKERIITGTFDLDMVIKERLEGAADTVPGYPTYMRERRPDVYEPLTRI